MNRSRPNEKLKRKREQKGTHKEYHMDGQLLTWANIKFFISKKYAKLR